MRKFGLIGYPLGHSFSKKYFTNKFEQEKIIACKYDNYPIESIEGIRDLIMGDPELIGLNVTIPYKEQVLDYLDEVDQVAKEVGAVNVIKILRNNNSIYLKGYNSDVFGFEYPLKQVIGNLHTKALILGTGGASKAVAWVLKKNNIDFSFVSRSPKTKGVISYEQLDRECIREHKIIVNTSPIGMYPNVTEAPKMNYSAITSEHILYDLVYNPEATQFLLNGAEKKAITLNGLPMLYLQAEKAWKIWNS